MRTLIVLTIATGVLLGGASVAVADPNLPNVHPHRHSVQLPSGGLVEVGPNLCEDRSVQQAFNQFHMNVHESAIAPGVFVPTLGPQHGAPGLHNGKGAEIVAGPC